MNSFQLHFNSISHFFCTIKHQQLKIHSSFMLFSFHSAIKIVKNPKLQHSSLNPTITMNNHHLPPPLTPHLHTTTEILRLATTLFLTRHHFPLFFILSTSLFLFRFQSETKIQLFTTAFDNEPIVKSYFGQIQNPAPLSATVITTTSRQYSKVDPRFFGNPPPKPQSNLSPFILDSSNSQSGFSNYESDNGSRVYETMHSTAELFFRSTEKEENVSIKIGHEFNSMSDVYTAFAVAYVSAHGGFLITQCIIHGIIFLLLVNHLLNNNVQPQTLFRNGSKMGLRRLYLLIILKWMVRDSLTRILAHIIFVNIDNPYTNYKIWIRLAFMPFSFGSPSVQGFENEFSSFLLYWFLSDVLISLVFSVITCLVLMVGPENNFWEVTQQGGDLLSLSVKPAISLQWLSTFYGWFSELVLKEYFGQFFAYHFKCFMEVYFVVAWMMYFFSLRSTDAHLKENPFGETELEAMINTD